MPLTITTASCQVIAQLINPAFGDTYSFPWTRGPHDQIIEYNDVMPLTDKIRLRVAKKFEHENFIKNLIKLYQSEPESLFVQKMVVLRTLTQLVRAKRDTTQREMMLLKTPAEIIKSNTTIITMLNQNL